jgi:hypothetical protein
MLAENARRHQKGKMMTYPNHLTTVTVQPRLPWHLLSVLAALASSQADFPAGHAADGGLVRADEATNASESWRHADRQDAADTGAMRPD